MQREIYIEIFMKLMTSKGMTKVLKNDSERKLYINNEANWGVIADIGEAGIKIKRLDLPNGAQVYAIVEWWETGRMSFGSFPDHYAVTKYILKDENGHMNRSISLSELVDYFKKHRDDLSELNVKKS